MTTPLPGAALNRATLRYAWCLSVPTPPRASDPVGPMVFVGEDGKALAVADADGFYVVRGDELVKAEGVEADWSERTISYRIP